MSNNLIAYIFMLAVLVACQEQPTYQNYKNSLAIFELDSLACSGKKGMFFTEFKATYQNLVAAHQPIAEPKKKDWLAVHEEKGQNFFQYAEQFPQQKSTQDTLYFIKIGDFTQNQTQLFQQVTTYIALFYQTPVKLLPAISLNNIESSAQRWGKKEKELHATYLINTLLPAQLPKHAIGLLGITAHNLYPSLQLSYVFGQASASHQTAVISLHQLGKLVTSQSKKRTKNRAIKLVSHEIGHVLGFAHCIAFSCVMNGSNHLSELDTKPPWFCPDCLSKLHWHSKIVRPKRFENLASYWQPKNSRYSTVYKQFSGLMHDDATRNREKTSVD